MIDISSLSHTLPTIMRDRSTAHSHAFLVQSLNLFCMVQVHARYISFLSFRPLIPSLHAQDSYQDKNNNMFSTMSLNVTHVPNLKHLEHTVTFPLRDIFPCSTRTMKVGSKILYISRRMWTFLNLHN